MTSFYDEQQIALIDQRIRVGQRKASATGTIVSRDTTGPGATVLQDGATVATPAKVAGTTFAQPGDRCMLDLYGSDWIVTNSFSSTAFGEANRALDALPSTATGPTSTAFIDLVEFGTFVFTKNFDNTFVRMQVQVQAFVTTAIAKPFWGLRLTPTSGGVGYTPADISMGGLQINALSTHITYTSMRRITGIPAGTYTVSLRWRRVSGTGTISADTNDAYAVELDERVRASSPIL